MDEISTALYEAEHASFLRTHIRWMIRRDMPEVVALEQASFELAWSEEDFLRCLRQRNCIGMVAEHGERVVGFMIYELHKSRLHILNFAVDPQYRRCGVGLQMVSKLIGKLSSHRRTRLSLEVRETNLPAQMFFKDQGFRAVRVLRGFYEDSGEDAYVLEYRLAGFADGGADGGADDARRDDAKRDDARRDDRGDGEQCTGTKGWS